MARKLWIATLLLSAACESGGDREAQDGFSTIKLGGGTADANPVKSDKDGDGKSEDNGEVTTGPAGANGRSLEQCTAEKKAWRAVVDSGRSPSDCVEQLVDWCCTRAEVLARFPTMAELLDGKFKTVLDDEQHVLYHCSYDSGTKRYTFHTAKITASGSVDYKWLYVDKVFPVETTKGGACQEVKTEDLRVGGEPDEDPSPSPSSSASPSPSPSPSPT